MRKSLLGIVMLFTTLLSATAQQVSPERAEKNWKKLAKIQAGKSIDIRLANVHWRCTLETWDSKN